MKTQRYQECTSFVQLWRLRWKLLIIPDTIRLFITWKKYIRKLRRNKEQVDSYQLQMATLPFCWRWAKSMASIRMNHVYTMDEVREHSRRREIENRS